MKIICIFSRKQNEENIKMEIQILENNKLMNIMETVKMQIVNNVSQRIKTQNILYAMEEYLSR